MLLVIEHMVNRFGEPSFLHRPLPDGSDPSGKTLA
jgi:hypothetical protein